MIPKSNIHAVLNIFIDVSNYILKYFHSYTTHYTYTDPPTHMYCIIFRREQYSVSRLRVHFIYFITRTYNMYVCISIEYKTTLTHDTRYPLAS